MENLPATVEGLKAISTGLESFEKLKSQLEKIADESKLIHLPDPNDKEQYKIIVEHRKKLKGLRIPIEKEGKSMRDLINPILKTISEKEKELVSIVSEEEKRLSKLEDEYDNHQQELKRKKEEEEKQRINNRIFMLRQVNHEHDYTDLVSMSDEQYEELLTTAKTEFHKEKERLRVEAEAEAKRIAEEKAVEQERKRKEQEEINRQKAEAEKIRKDQEAEAERLRLVEDENKRRAKQLADESEAFAKQKAEFELKQREEQEQLKKQKYETRVLRLTSIGAKLQGDGSVTMQNNLDSKLSNVLTKDKILELSEAEFFGCVQEFECTAKDNVEADKLEHERITKEAEERLKAEQERKRKEAELEEQRKKKLKAKAEAMKPDKRKALDFIHSLNYVIDRPLTPTQEVTDIITELIYTVDEAREAAKEKLKNL